MGPTGDELYGIGPMTAYRAAPQAEAQTLLDRRLRRRATVMIGLGAVASRVLLAAASMETETSRTSAVLMAPLFSFLVACVSPGASECDLNPPVLRGILFYASNVAAVTSICSRFESLSRRPSRMRRAAWRSCMRAGSRRERRTVVEVLKWFVRPHAICPFFYLE